MVYKAASAVAHDSANCTSPRGNSTRASVADKPLPRSLPGRGSHPPPAHPSVLPASPVDWPAAIRPQNVRAALRCAPAAPPPSPSDTPRASPAAPPAPRGIPASAPNTPAPRCALADSAAATPRGSPPATARGPHRSAESHDAFFLYSLRSENRPLPQTPSPPAAPAVAPL